MNAEQQQAYEWAKNQNYQSVAARYAKTLAGAVDDLQAQLTASQRRERAMLSDMAHEMECGACCHVRVDVCDEPCASCRRENSKFKWRGPQEAGEGE